MIEDHLRTAGVEIPSDGPINEPAPGPAPERPIGPPPWVAWARTQTGSGDLIPTYTEHPLNFRRDPEGRDGLARVIRAGTGWLGELNFAIVDLVLGLIQLAGAGRNRGGAPSA